MLKCKLCRRTRNVRADRVQYRRGYCSVVCMKKGEPVFFYDSKEWRKLRYQALKEYGRECALCKATEGVMHVDHIKPRSRFPDLALVFENLQVLCADCNMGKGNKDSIDWRSA